MRRILPPGARRLGVLAVTAVWAVAMASPLIVGGLVVAGIRPLAVRSGSMAPAIDAGDLVVARTVRADRVRPGDVITFQDPGGDRLITHRVIESRRRGPDLDFLTRGDANAVGEQWSVPARGRVGLVLARFPGVARATTLAARPGVRATAALVAVVALLVPPAHRRRETGDVSCDALV